MRVLRVDAGAGPDCAGVGPVRVQLVRGGTGTDTEHKFAQVFSNYVSIIMQTSRQIVPGINMVRFIV